MIGTAKKPFDEILGAMKGFEKIGVVGCDGCAKVCLTGGSDEVAALAQELKAQGKEIVFEASPERTCNMAKAKPILNPLKDRSRHPTPSWYWAAAGQSRSPAMSPRP